MAHGFARGRHVSWKLSVEAAAAVAKTAPRDRSEPEGMSAGFRLAEFRPADCRPPHIAVYILRRMNETGTDSVLALGIDTCGPSGSVSLGRITRTDVESLAQAELEGRTYSATLVAAVKQILEEGAAFLRQIGVLVVVNGPGSFTGVRVGLSAAKGFAEGAGIPVVSLSRLEVLSAKAAVQNAALDAHRQEIFLRLEGRELLAGRAELSGLPAPEACAVCDPQAESILNEAWPATRLLTVLPPSAADALLVAAPRIRAREFADVALLDGHYLRRSDAEIFGDPQVAAAHSK
ncbi:tRNA (adenosine(37)-N6)-threonylcarbamoyltransferase complex dimerization subunit type 1 TsaB [Acidobacteria bacterium AB60]|nr:tRNA (adenosine(37)-N6)-threonylcarbamoyltransferase complex dimerization subunit type 1 TsaB [Acidobacteria bacterium AB60]